MEAEAQVVDPPFHQGGLSEASSEIQTVPRTAAVVIEENESAVNDASQKAVGEMDEKHNLVIAQSCDAEFPQASKDQVESRNDKQNEGTVSLEQSGSEMTDGTGAIGQNSSVISETLIDAALTSERLPSQPEQNLQKDKNTTVKCAGCGKVFGQPCALPMRANRVMLSLCDDCENITSAMFICISCGQECSSLAALRAHKQTHVVPEQRIFVCEMCGVGFQRQNTLEEHKCAVLASQPGNKSDEKATSLQELQVSLSKGRSRKPRVTKKVRVEAIVSTLSKMSQQTEKKVPVVSHDISQKKTQPVKQVQSKRKQQARGRKKTIRKTPLPVPPTKATPTLKKKLLVDFQPPSTRRPRTERKVLTIPKVFECEQCSEFFTERKELKKHKAMHKKETFQCETCKKEFKSKPSLKRHELTHSDRPTTVCDICDKTFQSIHTLLTHKKTVHVDEKPYVCDICHKDFKQLGNMKTHRRTHTGEKPFVCTECGRPFAQMGNLQAHMVIHAASKPHVCEICGKSFSYIRSLQNHMRGTHTGERPFACEICEKTFSNQSVLRDHRRTHSDKRGYLCDKCGKGFKSYKNLKQHEKFHLDVRPYSCQVCGKGFVWFKSFQLHKRTHTGEKPYSCDQCDKVFSNIGSLKCHKRKHIYDGSAPPRKGRPTSKTHPSNIKGSPPPSPPSAPSQMMVIPHPSLHPIPTNTRDHMISSIQHHGDGSSTPTTTPIHHALPTHSQAYNHAVYPQALCSFVTNSTGDFTIL
ncbi:zinc finger protein 678-like [Lytechinus variegatus]|uniref:zinc finger protein 678-like n=1 Tax=Lytechinus variegatus TaxID=7654 RepID=UPI001BB1044D|nr:zinc finger protein 678-like [Lytechinus variegatus]